MSTLSSRRRIMIDVTEEQYQALDKYLLRGMRKVIFGYLIDDLIGMLKEDAPRVLAGILCRDISARDILKLEEVK